MGPTPCASASSSKVEVAKNCPASLFRPLAEPGLTARLTFCRGRTRLLLDTFAIARSRSQCQQSHASTLGLAVGTLSRRAEQTYTPHLILPRRYATHFI